MARWRRRPPDGAANSGSGRGNAASSRSIERSHGGANAAAPVFLKPLAPPSVSGPCRSIAVSEIRELQSTPSSRRRARNTAPPSGRMHPPLKLSLSCPNTRRRLPRHRCLKGDRPGAGLSQLRRILAAEPPLHPSATRRQNADCPCIVSRERQNPPDVHNDFRKFVPNLDDLLHPRFNMTPAGHSCRLCCDGANRERREPQPGRRRQPDHLA